MKHNLSFDGVIVLKFFIENNHENIIGKGIIIS